LELKLFSSNNNTSITRLPFTLGNTTPAVDVLQDNQGGAPFVSSWHLVKVESPDGYYDIDLTYTDEEYSYKQLSSCSRTTAYCGNDTVSGGQTALNCIGQIQDGSYFIRMDVEGQRLSTIITPTDTLTFTATTDRPDLDPITGGSTFPKQLDQISIQSGDFCKRFDFYYDYFLDDDDSSGTLTEYKRLKLDSLQEVSCDNSIEIPPHRFDYYGFLLSGKIALPNRLSKSIDHWGYHNGASNNSPVMVAVMTMPCVEVLAMTDSMGMQEMITSGVMPERILSCG